MRKNLLLLSLLLSALGLVGGCGSVLDPGGGSGGSGGAGGHGGSSGSGGAAGAGGGASCSDLATQYQDALPAAERCDVNAASQCQQSVSSALSFCGSCPIYVNDATTLNAIKATWQQAGCDNTVALCAAIACLQPSGGACVVADGGGGVCTSTSGVTTN
jgi:hypothetical protein